MPQKMIHKLKNVKNKIEIDVFEIKFFAIYFRFSSCVYFSYYSMSISHKMITTHFRLKKKQKKGPEKNCGSEFNVRTVFEMVHLIQI